MEWWKPKNNDPVTLRFTVTPNTYKTEPQEGKCPICDDLEKLKTRREKVATFITNLGWENSPISQAILKSLDDRIVQLEPKPVVDDTPVATKATVDRSIKITENDMEAWKTMTPLEKIKWCKTNLGGSLLNTIIERHKAVYSSIVGGRDNVIPNNDKVIGDSAHLFTSIPAKPVQPLTSKKKAQLTTKFTLTVDYIRQNVMPILHKYSLHEVDAFSALFAKFRHDTDYSVVLTVQDSSVFKMTPEIAINMVLNLYEQGHLK